MKRPGYALSERYYNPLHGHYIELQVFTFTRFSKVFLVQRQKLVPWPSWAWLAAWVNLKAFDDNVSCGLTILKHRCR